MGPDSQRPVRGFADAINDHDLDAALAACHPEIVFLSVLAVSGDAYVGHDGIRQYFTDIESAWAEWRVEVHRVAEAPDARVMIEMTMHARGKESGAPWSEFTAHLWTVRDGRLLRNAVFRHPDEALRAAGVGS
jgi:ketosteroid isomerase-like protein